MIKKKAIKNIFKITSNIFLYFFIAVCVFGIFVSVSSKKNGDDTATIFGYQMRFVLTESMEECDQTDVSDYKIKEIKKKSLIFVKTMPKEQSEQDEWYRSLKVGDVLTFKYVYSTQITITHRIVEIYEKPTGGFIIHLEGDNKNSDGNVLKQMIDTSIPENPNYVIGKVSGVSYLLGLIVHALKSPIGLVCMVILPCIIIVVIEIIKIASVISLQKRKKQESEIEILKKQLKELQNANNELTNQENEVDNL